MRALKSGGLAAAAVLLLSIAWPVSGGPGEGDLVFLGSSLWTKAHDVEVRGALAYCAFLDGLQILDLSDPRDPKALSALHLGGGFAVALAGETALVAAADKGLAMIDVRDPKAPVLKGLLDTPGEARDVAVDGSTAYVADGTGGLLAVDLADPAAPKIAGSWDSPGEATGLAIRGTTAFLADGSAGLQIVDIARPARLSPVGSLDTDGTAEGVALSGNVAYVADGSGGIKVVDVATPAGPKLAASLVASGYARSVAAEGKLLCVGSLYDGGYQVLDISDPRAPAFLSTNKYTMYNEAWRVVLREGRAIVVDYFSGLFFADLADPRKPKPVGYFRAPSTIVAVCGRDRYAFAVGELSGVLAVDAADPARPAVVLDGDFAYVADGLAGVKKIDISDPARPRLVSSFDTPGEAQNLCVLGKTILVADTYSLILLK